jgi:poly(3-hydroxybutyrate) depolymerase
VLALLACAACHASSPSASGVDSATRDVAAAADATSLDGANSGGTGGTGGTIGMHTDWPCTGCITGVPATYDPNVPMPLLVFLHGDEGAPGVVYSFWQQAAMDHGYILFTPECPRDLGCTGPWQDGSWAPGGPDASIAWINQQIDAVEAAYNVAIARVYLGGGSGGSVYTGYYVDRFAPRIAGAVMVSGGYSALSGTCQTCKTPLYILIGDQDFLLNLATLARDFYQGCGNEVNFDLMPGVDHQGGGESLTTGKGDAILNWFSARPNHCL